MAKMTKAQHAQYDKARANLDAKRSLVYAAAPDRDTPFSECKSMADDATRAAYDAAFDSLIKFEADMIVAGRAWRGTFGAFTPYDR